MKRPSKTRLLLTLLALLLTNACSSESSQNQPVTTTTNTSTSSAPPATDVTQRGNALVRVIHLLPGGPAFDVLADDTELFEGIAYKVTSPYKEVSVKSHTFRIRPTGQEAAPPLAVENIYLVDGRHYTVLAMQGPDETPSLDIVNDDLVAPPAGKINVRVVHASPDLDDVDIYSSEARLFTAVKGLQQTEFDALDPMTGAIDVKPYGQKISILTIPNTNFAAGGIYTILLLGKVNGTPKLEGIIVEDKLVAK